MGKHKIRHYLQLFLLLLRDEYLFQAGCENVTEETRFVYCKV